jgi:hypothetical protein
VLVSIGGAAFCAAAERLGEPVRLVELDAVDEGALAGVWLLHVPANTLVHEAARTATDLARRQHAMIAIDFTDDAPEAAGAKLAFEIAKLRPEILIARTETADALGVPLEGIARLPVLLLGERGVEVFGRRVPAPPGATANSAAFAAALCSAYLDGAMPVEAAGRAMVYAAGTEEKREGSSHAGTEGPPVI